MPYKYVQKTKSKGPTDSTHWGEKKKLEVLQSYLVTGNMRLSADLCGVPVVTARLWRQSPWWIETEGDLRRGNKIRLSSRLSNLVNKAIETLDDRLTNGDFVFHPKTGEWIRKPISAEHANKITAQLIDRTLAVEKAATPEKQTDEGLEARLTKLKNEMEKFAKKSAFQPTTPEIIDAVPSDSSPPDGPVEAQGVVPGSDRADGRAPEKPAIQYTPAMRALGLDDPNQPRVTLGKADNH